MKIFKVPVYLILLSVLFSCSKIETKEDSGTADDNNAEKSSIVKVMSENGMILREKPDRKSGKLAAIPWGTEIEMLESDGPFEIIDNVSGYWVKVKYSDKTGWVFGGYLTRKVGSDFVKITNNIDVFIQSGFNLKISWNDSKEEIIKKIGEPVKTETGKFISPADGREYPKYLLKYRTFIIETLEVPINNSINSIEVFSAEHVNLFNIKNGENIDRLINIIGEPSEIEKTDINGREYQVYQFIPVDNSLFQGLDVYTMKGKITKFLWYRAVD
ncbi:MAG: SH3 domain-containing protein [Spirochaetes bacterium]|nr:SH3 domain-containing protein [Spirochaetota bacterium]